MSALRHLPELIAFAAVLAAAASDLRRYEIPDWLSVLIALAAVVDGLLMPGFGWRSHLAAPALMFGFGLFAFSHGWLGGGDVKLMTALALWTGLRQLPVLLLGVALAGGVLVLLLNLLRRLAFASRDDASRPRLAREGEALPYAVAIAAGVVWWALTFRVPLG